MSKKPSLIPVTIAQWGQAHLMYLPLYVAIHSGQTEKLGLDVDLILAGNDDAIFKQVADGKVDFGFSDPVFVDMDKKKTTMCVALAVKRAAIWGVTHNPAIPLLKKVEDFVQLRIGSFPKPSTTYSLIDGLKQKHKRLLKYTQVIEAPIGKQAQLLVDNKADVVLELEPMVSLAESQGLRTVFSIAQFYGDAAFTGLITTKKMNDTKPQLVQKMVKALQYGLDVCRTDKRKALKIAQQAFPDYPSAILSKAIDRLNDSGVWPETTAIDPAVWKAAVKLRRLVGDMK